MKFVGIEWRFLPLYPSAGKLKYVVFCKERVLRGGAGLLFFSSRALLCNVGSVFFVLFELVFLFLPPGGGNEGGR